MVLRLAKAPVPKGAMTHLDGPSFQQGGTCKDTADVMEPIAGQSLHIPARRRTPRPRRCRSVIANRLPPRRAPALPHPGPRGRPGGVDAWTGAAPSSRAGSGRTATRRSNRIGHLPAQRLRAQPIAVFEEHHPQVGPDRDRPAPPQRAEAPPWVARRHIPRSSLQTRRTTKQLRFSDGWQHADQPGATGTASTEFPDGRAGTTVGSSRHHRRSRRHRSGPGRGSSHREPQQPHARSVGWSVNGAAPDQQANGAVLNQQ